MRFPAKTDRFDEKNGFSGDEVYSDDSSGHQKLLLLARGNKQPNNTTCGTLENSKGLVNEGSGQP